MSTPASAAVEVGAAVITRPDGRFLLAERPAGKVYAGYWEFPGGKIEPGETPLAGLKRELEEELGVRIVRAYPWLVRVFHYEHATVRLNFFRVVDWDGEPHGRENQHLAWMSPGEPALEPMLPANVPIFRALGLPPVQAITDAAERGAADLLTRLEAALDKGLRLVHVREKELPAADFAAFSAAVIGACRARGAKAVVNAGCESAGTVDADGLHLPAMKMMRLASRPDLALVGGSCHNAAELAHAATLDLDYVVLGPVRRTKSHPDTLPLGWQRFAELIAGYPLPVYALGGLTLADLHTAWECGAHGIAMQRAAWQHQDTTVAAFPCCKPADSARCR